MSKSSRKGTKGEREVAALYEAAGASVRGLEYAGDHLIITPSGLVIHSECKRGESLRIHEWLRQTERDAAPGTMPVLHFRRNRGRWYAVIPLDNFIDSLIE